MPNGVAREQILVVFFDLSEVVVRHNVSYSFQVR